MNRQIHLSLGVLAGMFLGQEARAGVDLALGGGVSPVNAIGQPVGTGVAYNVRLGILTNTMFAVDFDLFEARPVENAKVNSFGVGGRVYFGAAAIQPFVGTHIAYAMFDAGAPEGGLGFDGTGGVQFEITERFFAEANGRYGMKFGEPSFSWVAGLASIGMKFGQNTGGGGSRKATRKNASQAGGASLLAERPTADGLVEQLIDLNHDEQADVFNFYRERKETTRLLVRKEVDLNWDGTIDVRAWFTEDGEIEKEEIDGDFDGEVDWIDHYKGGRRVMSEIDTDYNGTLDLFKYYDNGKLRRKERDTTGDGRIDFWEYVDDGGQVLRTGRDLDADGVMDVRED